MGNKGYHYRLYGKQEPIFESHGCIRIHRVGNMPHPSAMRIPVEALWTELIYEYIKLPRSRLLQHSQDMLWQAARWNEFFYLIVFTSPFVLECLDSLKYSIAEATLDETGHQTCLSILMIPLLSISRICSFAWTR